MVSYLPKSTRRSNCEAVESAGCDLEFKMSPKVEAGSKILNLVFILKIQNLTGRLDRDLEAQMRNGPYFIYGPFIPAWGR